MAKPKGSKNDALYTRLNEMADRLNADLALADDELIGERTPYDWWKRTKGGRIDPAMPPPVINGRYPVWIYSRVLAWYKRYKRIG